ncbi:patatin-like phospholipase family protein [Pseudooceanicola sp.]|uniref:patatin-like phospholipase family protein n=1 Tax=Pseudooceanicola sp. TaxID=1914328 RepID=UPI002637D359|nr:patatin-like phospholipase family protein [Pseudooceanicola sp.]MDF1855125.1 patatin-like phospholipase family protein [Pseudooceanicola sp.]
MAFGLVLTGCAAINAPLNQPLAKGVNGPLVDPVNVSETDGEIWVGLAFSGGGMRASAFAAGMLEALRDTTQGAGDDDGILSDVRLVSGVSGGSVTAAWFGLKGAGGLAGYRDRFLVRDAEKYMAKSIYNPITIASGLSGGANGRSTYGRFLDETLFHGATFGDLSRQSRVTTWINASDIANQTTFLFSPETFDALCSDLSSYPLSDAIAASSAFPLVFSPITLESHAGTCGYNEPDWLTAARYNPEATGAMKSHAAALETYAAGDPVRYVKLLDGAITDNFGTTGLAVERARAQLPFAPLSAQEAVKLRRMLFLVANAGVQTDYSWTRNLRGPGGVQLAMAIASSAMASASRTGYDAMRLQLDKWQADLVEYRCALPASEVRRLRGSTRGWDCRDLKFFVGEVSFQGLPEPMKQKLDTIPTRLQLPVDQVDLALEAGRMATRQNPELNGFLRSTNRYGRARQLADAAGNIPGARRITPIKN